MGIFLRQLYKQKPEAWGPVSSVQASIFKNAEMAGIDTRLFDNAFPIWEKSGLPINYISGGRCQLCGGSTTTPSWGIRQSSGILSSLTDGFYSDTYQRAIPQYGDYTWIVSFYLVDTRSKAVIFGNRNDGIASPLQFMKITNARSEFYNASDQGVSYPSIVNDTNNFFILTKTQQTLIAYINGVQVGINTDTTKSMGANPLIFGNGSLSAIVETLAAFYYQAYTGAFYLNPSKVAFLSDNPYFLLHRKAPVFYSVPGGAITIKTVTDTGSGLDGIAQISNILSVADSGSGFDVFAGLAAGISVVDVGSGTDAVQPAASVTVQDTGVAIELIQQISAACSVADTGTGADNIVRLLASLFVSDTGAGSDIITVLKELLKTVTDSGTGTDSVSQLLATVSVGDTGSCTDTISQILADISVSDTGTGADFINLLKDILKTISDTGTGTDFVSIQPVSVSVYDAGMALDLIGHIAVALSVSDAGTVAEIISTIKTKLVTVTDTGTGSDSAPTISVSLTVSDVSAALDVVGQVLNSLTVSDTGSGLDRITKTDFNILPSGKVTVTFTIKTPGASFAIRTPKATFNIE